MTEQEHKKMIDDFSGDELLIKNGAVKKDKWDAINYPHAVPTGEVIMPMNPDLNDSHYFLMRTKNQYFFMGLENVLRCLQLAENEGIVPELPSEWWSMVCASYPDLSIPVDAPPYNDIVDPTESAKDIYRFARDNFDLAVRIIEEDTGILVTQKLARQMLSDYKSAQGHMYYDATFYNIPWKFLHCLSSKSCFGLYVKRESELWQYLRSRDDVHLIRCDIEGYDFVDNRGKYLNLFFATILHKRKIINDKVQETIEFTISSRKEYGLPKTEHVISLSIDENRFPSLIAKTSNRNQIWLDLAKEELGEI